MRLFNVLANFLFTKSETIRDYYLWTWHIRVASWVAERVRTQDLRRLGNIRKALKLHRIIAQCPVSPLKWKFCWYYQKTFKNQKLNFSRSALLYTKTRVGVKYHVKDWGLRFPKPQVTSWLISLLKNLRHVFHAPKATETRARGEETSKLKQNLQ